MSCPSTRQAMVRAGYKRTGSGGCWKCRSSFEWWASPTGTKYRLNLTPAPIDIPEHLDTNPVVHHSATCTGEKKQPEQPSLWDGTPAQRTQAAQALATACRARVVVVIQEDGQMTFSHRKDIAGDDIAHEIITAANNIRRQLGADHVEPWGPK